MLSQNRLQAKRRRKEQKRARRRVGIRTLLVGMGRDALANASGRGRAPGVYAMADGQDASTIRGSASIAVGGGIIAGEPDVRIISASEAGATASPNDNILTESLWSSMITRLIHD